MSASLAHTSSLRAGNLAWREARVRDLFAALGSGQLTRLASVLAPDAVLDDPLGGELCGPAALEKWMRAQARLFPRAAYEPLRLLLHGSVGAIEWRARLRRADGREFNLAGAAIVEFTNDRIVRITLYYDGRSLHDGYADAESERREPSRITRMG